MEGKTLKRCSTAKPDHALNKGKTIKRCSADAKPDHGLSKCTKPYLQKAEGELENLETDVNPKKQMIHKEISENKQFDGDGLELKLKLKKQKKHKKKKEMKKLRKSFKEMTETMKNLQEFLEGKPDLRGISLKEMLMANVTSNLFTETTTQPQMLMAKAPKEEETPKKTEKLAEYECNFKTAESDGNNSYTIFVKGFDASLPKNDIKSALTEHFSSCGVVTRVYVPIECQTGASLGFAFIDVEDNKKALNLGLSYMGGRQLDVRMARYQREYHVLRNFTGCERCAGYKLERRLDRFYHPY